MPALSRASLQRLPGPVNAGIAALGIALVGIGYGSLLAVVVSLALAFLWWGRALGLAALFALALSVAGWINSGRTPPPRSAAVSTAGSAGAELGYAAPVRILRIEQGRLWPAPLRSDDRKILDQRGCKYVAHVVASARERTGR